MANAETAALLRDGRVECWSLMTTMAVGEYLDLTSAAYANKGGLLGQREPLKSTSGRRIRSRMIQDIKEGAVLPPLVVGVIVPKSDFENLEVKSTAEIRDLIRSSWQATVSVIDGMQRTTALLDAVDGEPKVADATLRVEFWLSPTTESLIYRMLVLNTGQVPWNLKRQLQVVFAPLIAEMGEHVKFTRLITLEEPGSRKKGGEFSADSLMESYIAFGLRRTDIDTQETLADEFSRLDMADAISTHKYKEFFYPIVQSLVDLDIAFAAYLADDDDTKGFTSGRHLFDSQPARIGYVTACAVAVLGRIGMDREVTESENAVAHLTANVASLVDRLGKMSSDDLQAFLALDVLSEKLSGQKRSAVGRFERAYFERAFAILIEQGFAVPSLETCWRSA